MFYPNPYHQLTMRPNEVETSPEAIAHPSTGKASARLLWTEAVQKLFCFDLIDHKIRKVFSTLRHHEFLFLTHAMPIIPVFDALEVGKSFLYP